MPPDVLEQLRMLDPRVQVIMARRELARRKRLRTIMDMFPDDGPFARHLYPKHLEFFQAGALHRQRLFLAGNRVGKSRAGCFEDTLHLTGAYDRFAPWWQGKRFTRPIKAWIWATTDEKLKETVQEELFGPPGQWGTGLIPQEHIHKIDRAVGPLKDLIDTAYIKHVSYTGLTPGGLSVVQFKSYKQGRQAAEGTFRDLIHLDEEAPADIHGECLLRTMDTTGTGDGNGIMLLTFTPLQGLSETVLQYLPDGQLPTLEQTGPQYVVNATWDDVPHLDDATKAELLKSIPPYLRDARSRGLPLLGAGVIYPVPEDDYSVPPFELPKHWPRVYAMDVGWNWTAGLWGAYDRESDTWYIYYEYKRAQAEPSIHARGMQGPGSWIPGVIDPAANGRSQHDGTQLLNQYLALGLHLSSASNAVESGIYDVWEHLSTGRLKIFQSLNAFRAEIRLYRRDEKGRIVKVNDHLMDCLRYLMNSGKGVMKVNLAAQEAPTPQQRFIDARRRLQGWMA